MTNDELWIRLRRLQTNAAHVPLRGPILSAFEDGCREWADLRDRLTEIGVDLERIWRESPEPAFVAETEAKRLRANGMTPLTPLSPDYPARWLACGDPPLTLSVLGGLANLGSPALSVVGSREPSPESLRWMELELSSFCKDTRPVIVSGGARGVDQRAHAIALRTGAPTIAFLPSGLDDPYPADLKRWFPAIVEGGGAVVSEYPMNARMWKANFHHRNRLIAAAARIVLIVEARSKSGTLITAARAAEIGRSLLVVPGHPGDVRFAGNLSLLSEGATLVRHAEDLTLFWQAEELGEDGEGLQLGHSAGASPDG